MTALAVACHNMSMGQFAPILQGFGGGYFDNKLVVDATGLSDKYDFEIQWTPSGVLARAGSDGVTIFDAMQKQLGLRLDLKTAPRPALIVDQVTVFPRRTRPASQRLFRRSRPRSSRWPSSSQADRTSR
jgi:uncharacterized protein (TIGR03435 family)